MKNKNVTNLNKLSTAPELTLTYALSTALIVICVLTNQKLFVIPISILLIYIMLKSTLFWIEFYDDHFVFKNPIKRQAIKFNYTDVEFFKIKKNNLSSKKSALYSLKIQLHPIPKVKFTSILVSFNDYNAFSHFLSKKAKLINL